MLPYALKNITVGQILFIGEPGDYGAPTFRMNASNATSGAFTGWLADEFDVSERVVLDESDIDDLDDPSDDIFDSGDVDVFIVAADIGDVPNARSIVLMISYDNFDALLMGDATFETVSLPKNDGHTDRNVRRSFVRTRRG